MDSMASRVGAIKVGNLQSGIEKSITTKEERLPCGKVQVSTRRNLARPTRFAWPCEALKEYQKVTGCLLTEKRFREDSLRRRGRRKGGKGGGATLGSDDGGEDVK